MRQEQVQRRPQRHGRPDTDTEDTEPIGTPDHAARASQAASDALRAIDDTLTRETDS